MRAWEPPASSRCSRHRWLRSTFICRFARISVRIAISRNGPTASARRTVSCARCEAEIDAAPALAGDRRCSSAAARRIRFRRMRSLRLSSFCASVSRCPRMPRCRSKPIRTRTCARVSTSCARGRQPPLDRRAIVRAGRTARRSDGGIRRTTSRSSCARARDSRIRQRLARFDVRRPRCRRSASWERSLEAALALGVEHISTYGLTIEEGDAVRAWQARQPEAFAGDDREAEQYALAIERLTAAGFEHYEISAILRGPGFAASTTQNYWHNGDYLGLRRRRGVVSRRRPVDPYRATATSTSAPRWPASRSLGVPRIWPGRAQPAKR